MGIARQHPYTGCPILSHMGTITMKLPNNYGSITKLKGNRRKPYMVRVTVEWITDKNGKQKQSRKIVGYASTRQEAIQILAEYNNKPYDLDKREFTFKQAYQAWYKEYESTGNRSHSSLIGYSASFNAVPTLHDRPIRELKATDLQNAITQSGKNFPTMKKIRLMVKQVYKYSIKNDICTTDYADYIDISAYHDKNPNAINRTPFTSEEIAQLWANANDRNVKIVLMYIYTGVRASELLDLKKCDVDMKNMVFHVRASKTTSGIRVVPIANKVAPFFREFMEEQGEYLITITGAHACYWNYANTYFKPLMKELGMSHHIHDTRHTCISMLALADVNQTTIKKIVGHKGAMSLTERVYTHLDYAELLEAINRI